MTTISNSIADVRHRLYVPLVAMILTIATTAAQAVEPVTHHFSIARPSSPVVAGVPAEFEITARLDNNKINKKGDHKLLIQITSAQGAQPKTITREADMKHGVARVSLSFTDVGPTILQVTDKANAHLTNSTTVSVLPQPRKREVRS